MLPNAPIAPLSQCPATIAGRAIATGRPRRCAACVLIHVPRREQAALELRSLGIEQQVDALARGQSVVAMLAFSALLMAGLDGIQNKIEPADPIDKDIYELPPDEMADINQVPTSLNAVLDNLERDHEFLTAGNVFTPDLIETWIDFKRTQEILPVQLRPHPHEFELYYDI